VVHNWINELLPVMWCTAIRQADRASVWMNRWIIGICVWMCLSSISWNYSLTHTAEFCWCVLQTKHRSLLHVTANV